MKRKIHTRRVTPKEATRYGAIRKHVAGELPELVRRHEKRMAARDRLQELCEQLKAARERKGLSLADLSEMTGMDRSAISKLESGQRPNPTLETLLRYAEAVGKQLDWTLADAVK